MGSLAGQSRWAVSLGLGDGDIVQHLGHGCYGSNCLRCLQRALEGVRHQVVLFGNVPEIPCELGHITEVATLECCPRLHRLGEGKGERLVVRVEGETAPLQHETEVADSQYAGQQFPVVGRVTDLGGVQFPGEEAQRLSGHGWGCSLLECCSHLLRGCVHHQGQLRLGPGKGKAGGGPQGVLGCLERGLHLLRPLYRRSRFWAVATGLFICWIFFC